MQPTSCWGSRWSATAQRSSNCCLSYPRGRGSGCRCLRSPKNRGRQRSGRWSPTMCSSKARWRQRHWSPTTSRPTVFENARARLRANPIDPLCFSANVGNGPRSGSKRIWAKRSFGSRRTGHEWVGVGPMKQVLRSAAFWLTDSVSRGYSEDGRRS